MSSKNRERSIHFPSDSTLRKAFSVFFAFLLALSLFLLTLLAVFRFGIVSQDAFLSLIDEDYAKYTLEEIRADADYYVTPTGIDPSVLDGVFTTEGIIADVRAGIANSFAGKEEEYVPDTAAYEAKLDSQIRAFLEENNLEPKDGTTDELITHFTTDIMKIYTNEASLPAMSLFTQVYSFSMKYGIAAIIGLAVLALIFLVTCLKLHYFFHRGLRYVAYSFGGVGLMSLAIPGWLYFSKFYNGFNLQPHYFYHFAVTLVVRLLRYVMAAGVFWLVLTVILAVIISIRRAALMKG
ncbi:MAG: hypothetical protein IKR00_03770 [Lachnospiraceae bacterium]|nr:hypothetical protein [Lachnospiraceae bacterium]